MSKVTETHRDYSFIQEVGGMRVSAPELQEDGSFFLPLALDVSGASRVTHEPKKYHAKIAIKDVHVEPSKTNSNRLFIFVETAWPGKLAVSPRTRGVKMGTLSAGQYTLEYLNRDESTVFLGKFTIEDYSIKTETNTSSMKMESSETSTVNN